MRRKGVFPVHVWAIAGLLTGCGHGGGSDQATEDHPRPAEAARKDEPVKPIELNREAQRTGGIETLPAAMRLMQEMLKVPGVVGSTSQGHALVTPPVAGRVIAIQVRLGDVVRKGRSLAVIESPDLATAWAAVAEAERIRDATGSDLKQAQAESALAFAKVEAVKTTLKRQQDLAKAGAFSQAPLQQARTELNEAQSELLTAQREQGYTADQLKRAETLSKDGLVARKDLESAQLAASQANIAEAKAAAKVEIAKDTYARERSIEGQGLLNAKEIQTAGAEVRSSELEKEQASIKVRSARAALANAEGAISNARVTYRAIGGSGAPSLGRTTLVAPISGTVTALTCTQGQAVDRTQAVMDIEDLSTVWVTANVAEEDVSRVKVGNPCTVETASSPGRDFRGTVVVVGSDLDPKTRTLPVQCQVSGAHGALKPQMFANVLLRVGPRSPAVAVPMTALVHDGNEVYVFVRRGDTFERRSVETGRSERGFVEIKHGIESGELVAVKGAFVLRSESKKDEMKGDND